MLVKQGGFLRPARVSVLAVTSHGQEAENRRLWRLLAPVYPLGTMQMNSVRNALREPIRHPQPASNRVRYAARVGPRGRTL